MNGLQRAGKAHRAGVVQDVSVLLVPVTLPQQDSEVLHDTSYSLELDSSTCARTTGSH
jgi:hypothetical protein